MRPPKREASALADSLPQKSARPRRDAAMKQSPTTKNKSGKPADAATKVEEVVETTSTADGGPFPSWRRPSPAECFAARDALALLHGEPGAIPAPSSPLSSPPSKAFSDPDGCHSDDCLSVLDSLVRTILSQNTTDATSARAFRSLKIALPTWEEARTTPVGIMEEAIRVGGLAEIKAARIRKILETVRAEALEKKKKNGGGTEKEDDEKKKKKKKASDETTADSDYNNSLLSLEYLREWPDAEEVKQELVRFNGVGPKTAGAFFLPLFSFFSFSPFPLSHLPFPPKNHSLRRSLRAQEGRLPGRHAHPPYRRVARLDSEKLNSGTLLRAPAPQGSGFCRSRPARAAGGAWEGLQEVRERWEGRRGRGEMRDEARGRGGCRGGDGGSEGGGGVSRCFVSASLSHAPLFLFLSFLPGL